MEKCAGIQENGFGKLTIGRVKPQHHPIQAGVETALANCGSITIS